MWAQAKWPETIHLVNNRDCWVGKEEREPLNGQETTHLGVTWVLEADKKGGKRCESPVFKCNLFLIMPSLQ